MPGLPSYRRTSIEEEEEEVEEETTERASLKGSRISLWKEETRVLNIGRSQEARRGKRTKERNLTVERENARGRTRRMQRVVGKLKKLRPPDFIE